MIWSILLEWDLSLVPLVDRGALNFVLENPRVDRTLLFNIIKLVRIDKANGQGGFVRG